MHGGLLMLAGSRMAKSAGNFFRVTELEEQGLDPLAFRYLMLQAKYRAPLNFSNEGMAGADRAVRQLRDRVTEWSRAGGSVDEAWDARFRAALADDLDLPAAMALVSALVKSDLRPGDKAATLLAWDRVLGMDLDQAAPSIPGEAKRLLEARERARAAKDFAESDRLRDQLAGMGVTVIDTPEGQRVKG